jgi:hypothetical protein
MFLGSEAVVPPWLRLRAVARDDASVRVKFPVLGEVVLICDVFQVSLTNSPHQEPPVIPAQAGTQGDALEAAAWIDAF